MQKLRWSALGLTKGVCHITVGAINYFTRMQNKLLVSALVVLVLLGGAVLVWEKQTGEILLQNQVKEVEKVMNEPQVFVTNVDPDVSHWQTKETEFFTIKFPKEWYWMESDLKETGYHSTVITNNPDFPISEYPDIGIGTGGNYPIVLRNAFEIVISTNGLGWVTLDAGSPREFLELEMDRVKKYVNSSAECSYIPNLKDTPLISRCSYIDAISSQRVITYYSADIKRTFAYSARMTKENNVNLEPIFELIIKNFVRKNDF